MKIRLAFALSHNNVFEEKHFGEADKYLVYELNSNGMILLSEEINPFKTFEGSQIHGSAKKGEAVISFLKELGVSILVSRRFGQNIRMVNRHFIPVIINKEEPGQVSKILMKHIKWLQDELENKPSEYGVFTLNNGILKSRVKTK